MTTLSRLGWRVYSRVRLALHPHAFFNQLYRLDWYQTMLGDWLTWLDPPTGSHVLELGCSSGGFSASLGQRGYRVTGMDRSTRAIQYAQQHHATAHSAYLVGDALQLPWQTPSFTVTLAASLLNVVDAPQNLIKEMARVTTADGIVSCLFPTPAMHTVTAEQFIQAHGLSGFSANALSLWASAANKLEVTEITSLFQATGLSNIHTATFLDGMVAGVRATVPAASSTR